jgi:hypothetical protein
MLPAGGLPWRMNRALQGLWVGGEVRRQECGASAYLRILGGRAKGSVLECASAGAVLEAAQAAAPIEEARDRRELIVKKRAFRSTKKDAPLFSRQCRASPIASACQRTGIWREVSMQLSMNVLDSAIWAV